MKKRSSNAYFYSALVLTIILLIGYFSIKEKPIPEEITLLEFDIENCITDIGLDGLSIVGLQGGYINPGINSFKSDEITVAYGYLDNKNLLISLDDIKKELSSYITYNLDNCIIQENIEYDKLEVEVNIEDNLVNYFVSFQVVAYHKNKKYDLKSEYLVGYPVRLKKLHNEMNLLVEETKNSDGKFNILHSVDEDFNMTVMHEDNSYVVAITDSNPEFIEYSFFSAFKLAQ